MKRYALIFLAAIFVPSLILGWLALRTAGEQRVLIERQAADLHQAETDALAAEMRALIEEKQHAFDEIVRALISKQDAAALAGDYGNQLFSAWHEGGIPFAISPEGILVFPTPAHAVTNPAFEEFLWYNSAFLSNNTVEEVFQTQQTSSFKENSPHEKEAGRTARAATIPITTNPPSDKADTRLQKERSPPRSIVPLRGTPDTQSSAFSRVAPEFSNFRMAVEGAANGVLSRFVQNDLQLFFWTHPDPNEGWLFGLVLGPGELSRLASGILPKRSGNTTWVAILNDKAKPVSKSPAEFAAKWKRPFVATEIGEFLPHWEVALYLANPAQFRESARLVTITVILLIALALAAILAGGYLVALDTRRQLAIAQQKTDFVSNVSHELKTPLTSIRMFAELLAEDRVKEPEKRSRYLRIIVSESERLARLVNNVLDFARIERKRKSYRYAAGRCPPGDRTHLGSRVRQVAGSRLRRGVDFR